LNKLDRLRLLLKILFVIIILDSTYVEAQENQANDVIWYNQLFDEGYKNTIEHHLEYNTSQLTKAIDESNVRAQAKILTELGLIQLIRTNDYERAMDYFTQARALEDSLNLHHEQIFTYLAIARIFEEVAEYEKSIQYLEDAISLNEQSKDASILVLILNALGKNHAAQGHIEKAFEQYELALGYKDQIDDPEAEAEVYFNLGNLDLMQSKFATALENHKKALNIRRNEKDKKKEALSLHTIGILYQYMKNNDRALANHVASLEIRQRLKDKKGIAESYNNIAALYYQQKNPARAIANLQLGLEAARESQYKEEIRKSYEYLAMCYSSLGDYKKALEYKDSYLAIHDFIQHEKSEHQLLETENRYALDKKETQIGKLESDRIQGEKELLAQKKIQNFLMATVVLGIIIILLVIYFYMMKRRSNIALKVANDEVKEKNLELSNLNATKDKFFSIISHDLKGPLNSLTSFSGLLINHLESLSKEEIQMLAKDLDKSLKNLFVLLENLLEWSRSQTGNIEFKPVPFDLSAVLQQNKDLLNTQAQNKKINILNEATSVVTVHAHQQSVNTVVRNLLSNSIKFTPEGGTITLSLRQTGNEAQVSIADTGVGMSKEVMDKLFRIDTKHSTQGTANEKGTGLGLILCKEFIEKNGGRIWVQSEIGKGSVFAFTLPA
jgi:signal transduction histidine kinase